MAENARIAENRALIARWARVWEEGCFDLIPACLTPTYLRHTALQGTQSLRREDYAKQIAAQRERFPDVRFVLQDLTITEDRVWGRWTWRQTDPTTGTVTTRAGLQVYRIEDGKLAETWSASHEPGSYWPDYQPDQDVTPRV